MTTGDRSGEEPRTSFSDEEWARFQAESEGPARLDAPKEPSARARMVAERFRQADELAARRRGRIRRLTRRGRRERAEPDAWRAWSAPGRTRVRRNGVWLFIWIAVAVGFLLALIAPGRVLPFLF